jgi:hypothetical protein
MRNVALAGADLTTSGGMDQRHMRDRMALKLTGDFAPQRNHNNASARHGAQHVNPRHKFRSLFRRIGSLSEQVGEAAFARLYARSAQSFMECPSGNPPIVPRPAFALRSGRRLFADEKEARRVRD